jgi:predicted aspartyl protease
MKILFIKQFCAVLFTFVLLAGSIAAQTAEQPIEINLDHKALGKAATVSVQIGAKTYPFLLDTGSGVTIITPEIAQEIGCTPFGRISGLDTYGKKLDMQRCDQVELKMDGFTAKVDAAVRNIMPFFSPETPQIGGVIALQTFENKAITIDLAGNKIRVETADSLAERIKEMRQLETRVSRPFTGVGLEILAAASTPKGKVWMIFDTGNTNWSHVAPHALNQIGVSLDAPNKAKIVKPVKLDINGFGQFEFMGREREMIYDVRLNYDTLTKLVYTVDLRTGKMWVKSNPEQPAAAAK